MKVQILAVIMRRKTCGISFIRRLQLLIAMKVRTFSSRWTTLRVGSSLETWRAINTMCTRTFLAWARWQRKRGAPKSLNKCLKRLSVKEPDQALTKTDFKKDWLSLTRVPIWNQVHKELIDIKLQGHSRILQKVSNLWRVLLNKIAIIHPRIARRSIDLNSHQLNRSKYKGVRSWSWNQTQMSYSAL